MLPNMVPCRLQRQGPLTEEWRGAMQGPMKGAMADLPPRPLCERQMSGEHSPTCVIAASSSAFDSDSSDTEPDHEEQDPIKSQIDTTRVSPLPSVPPVSVPLTPLSLTTSAESSSSAEGPGCRGGSCLSPPPQRVTAKQRLQRKGRSWGSELKLKPYAPLSRAEWERAFERGPARRLRNAGLDVVRRVRLGGCEDSVRSEVWPFLLGLYDFSSTEQEREAERSRLEAGFAELRRQARLASRCIQTAEMHRRCTEGAEGQGGSDSWEELTCSLPEAFRAPPREGDGGLGAFTVWSRTMRLDAVRVNDQWVPHSCQGVPDADVTLRMVQEAGLQDWEHLSLEQQLHAARLVGILEAYAMHDPLIGYCQGMTDLLSPFVALLADDCDAFWCFARFMESARHNFRTDEVGIRRQLDAVAGILASCDRQLSRHLAEIGAQDCLFAYRMVLVLLRRELSFEDTVSLWEVLWAEAAPAAASEAPAAPAASASRRPSPPSSPSAGAGASGLGRMDPAQPEFFLYTVAAVIVSRRKAILDCEELDEVLCSCTNLAGKFDVWDVIALARGLISLASWRAER